MSHPKILCVSFSPLLRDARVLRQLEVLKEFGEVITVGYGPAPEGVAEHIEIDGGAPSLPQTPGGIAKLTLRRYRSVELTSPAEKDVLESVLSLGRLDLVVANDARALPLASRAAEGAPILADMHEWAPEENAGSLPWRVLVGPYMTHLCRRYLPLVNGITTVNDSIARAYERNFGVRARVVRNAGAHRDLRPSPMQPDLVRLVHSGIAVPGRNIEALIDATIAAGDRFSLDLYLLGNDPYLRSLKDRAKGTGRIRFQDPVEPDALPATLNKYDLGVFLLPPTNINTRLMLPNKFFDFVQARLGIVFGPSEETSRLIQTLGLGVVTDAWDAEDLTASLVDLSADDIAGFKEASHRASALLSSETDRTVQMTMVSELLQLPRAR